MGKMIFFSALLMLLAVILLFLLIPRSPARPLARETLNINGNLLYVEVADTSAARSQGLSDREQLAENQGMLFVFPVPAIYPFWMKDMKFPIDIIWIRGNKVIGVADNAAVPGGATLPIYSPPGLMDKVLEVGVGVAAKLGIKEGTIIKQQD
ncbi:MAG: DUF192 domain-containing protein [bacterium]|nr:DUF192 domain-containing protein [bacterium]